ncbi:ATP-binding protein [Streptomyces sp. DI166]|uniref:ATP-binding protein n=1 Tax=Streptomyces sp. DI166 TaxID=1839783 RepID=UPI000B890C5E|nr:AAA family ATPase [Streptomyces sp. DI166]
MSGPLSGLLLGREDVLRAVRGQVQRAVGGHGGVLLVTGEAGIGKSSLAGCVVEEARAGGLTVLRGACWDADGTPGLWPWMQVVRTLRRSVPAQTWKAASDAAGVASEILCGGSGGSGSGPGGVDQFQLFDAVTTLLTTAAQQQPLLVVLEDVHWADTASVALLEFAAQHLSLERVLVLATCRDVEIERPDHPLRDRLRSLMTRAVTLALPGLGVADVAELMHRTAGRTPDDALVAEVLRRTGGNPFFVQEVARLWAAGHEVTAVSPGLRASLQERLRLLEAPVADCLGAASVLGRRFCPGVLARVLGCPEAQVRGWLARAADGQLVEIQNPAVAVFKHDLVRETLYGDLDAQRARGLHAAAVNALRETAGASADVILPVELARHAHLAFEELDRDEAVELMLSAARHAEHRLAHEEAVGHYGRALDRLSGADPARRVLVGLDLGLALQVTGEQERSWRVFEEAATLADGLARPLLMGRTALTLYGADGRGDTTRLRQSALSWAHAQFTASGTTTTTTTPTDRTAGGRPGAGDGAELHLPESDLARTVAAAVVAQARAEGDDDALHVGLWARMQAEWGPQAAGGRRDLAAELAQVSRRRGDCWTEHVAMSMRWVAALEADDPHFLEALHAMAAVAAADGSARLRLTSVIDRSVVHAMAGRFAEAERLLDESATLSASGPSYLRHFQAHHRWTLLVLRGEFTEARSSLEALRPGEHPYVHVLDALTDLEAGERPTGPVPRPGVGADEDTALFRILAPLWLRCQAQGAAATGHPAWCDDAYAALAPYEGQWLVSLLGWDIGGPATLWLGVLDAARGRWDSAVRHLTAALRSAERLHAPPWALRARIELARVLAERGGPVSGHDLATLLKEATSQAQNLGMTHLLTRIEHLPTHPPDRQPPTPSCEFRCNGQVWHLTYEGRTVHLPDAKGLRDLHTLLSLPGQDIPAVHLLNPQDEAVAAAHGVGADEVLDEEARRRYRRHLEQLETEIDRAVERGEDARAAAYDQERAALLDELRRHAGLAGRPRRLGDPRERARKNVTARIRDTLRRLDDQHPALAAHLRRTVSTGTMCRYTPDEDIHWHL